MRGHLSLQDSRDVVQSLDDRIGCPRPLLGAPVEHEVRLGRCVRYGTVKNESGEGIMVQ